ncbi:hypothetical protein [Rufibacter tibetensis]|uniref:Lipoprotein n=1 Tax=Rufibacter tibetensis TaxID=512763 RepID=A0A0P0CQ22_9BACT|nr:hypothetical protein [Rufibacter tibetensis]ALI99444.1 hypothetical protein DC20_11290 [Rufibacter tibetensis]
MKRVIWSFLVCAGLMAFSGCEEEEVSSDCFEAVVLDQGCGTVLAVLDTAAASIVGAKPSNDSVYVNTFDLHPFYQVPGKRLYITIKSVPPDEAPQCPGFIPIIYPHIRVLTVSETPCD